VCLGWGELPQFADCGGCSSWRQKHTGRAPCRRCGHDSHVNTDGLCRLCLQAIRTEDPGWILNPVAGRPAQLRLILPGVHIPIAQPLDKSFRGRPSPRERPPSWLERLRAAKAEPVDDQRVCPPSMGGQIALLHGHRRMTLDHARRIRDRELPGYAQARAAVIAYANERGFSSAWWRTVDLRIRLALAVRDADGEDLVCEESLDDLPGFADATGEILRRVGLLRPRCSPRPLTSAKRLRNCEHCGCWGFHRVCPPCGHWRKHPAGDCSRCGRSGLPLLEGLCRGCRVHVDMHGPGALTEPWTQLWLGGTLALKLQTKLRTKSGSFGSTPHRHGARQRAAAGRPSVPPVSAHLVDPAQPALFEARRDWSCIAIGSLAQLPSLTPSAQALLDAFGQYARDRAWDCQVRRLAARSLRILLAWVGADAPIPEADIRALPTERPGTTARRVVQFLAQVDLLIPDPARRIDPDEAAVEQRIRSLPAGMHDELDRWIQVLRGEGRRQHPVRSFETIRKYLGYVYPALEAWAEHVTSLREVTPEDVRQAIGERRGNAARSMHTGLSSLFRALKQERLVFRDPTRGVSLPKVEHLPCPIPTDSLRGLIDRAAGPMAKLVVALVAIHGLGKFELTRLQLLDLDLSHGRLVVRRDNRRHTVYLDELTHTLASVWLRERHRRWPVTANPHLLVSQQTAADDTVPPVSGLVITLIFEPLGLSPSKLRQDRILDEARHTADPVHLMTVFGIAAATAMRYVYAAHPERRSVLPR